MKDALTSAYPGLLGRVHVVPQPVPAWLLRYRSVRTKRIGKPCDLLKLVYPAAIYPHKNHKLLSSLTTKESIDWPVSQLFLTIDGSLNPASVVPWIDCIGFLAPQQMLQCYCKVDALLFLSKDESYGFPLVEAMHVGLPIVCPDLPYARMLCHDEAIYFDPDSILSLRNAIDTLRIRLDAGWWPNWSSQLAVLPESWDSVANQMIRIALRA
jgi:glycosyltransferase involved in cell wall biosynthesis